MKEAIELIVGLLLVSMFLLAIEEARGESIPYGHGCVTSVVIQPDGKRIICTTCPTGAGQAVTICQ